jgi:hypothetical protein
MKRKKKSKKQELFINKGSGSIVDDYSKITLEAQKGRVKDVFTYIFNGLINVSKHIFSFLREVIKDNIKYIIILFAIFWFIKYVEGKVDFNILDRYLSSSRSEFAEGEVSKLEVNLPKREVIEHTKGQSPKLITGVVRVRASKFDDGTYRVKYKNKGIGIEPGLTAYAGDGLRIGVDAEFVYWKRWGLLGGGTVPIEGRSFNRLRGHLGLSYDLPSRWFTNTSLWGGMDSSRSPVGGVRLRF